MRKTQEEQRLKHNPYATPKTADLATPVLSEKPNPYSMDGRIGRLRYLAWSMAFLLLCAPVLIACLWLSAKLSLSYFGVLAGLFIALLFIVRIGAQRLHDMGLSAWFLLILLIPLIGGLFSLAMLLVPGNRGSNAWGPPPAPNNIAVYLLASLWLLLIIFALFGGISRAPIGQL